jgi:tetratricopeptide (TPR) repeat protein
MPSLFREKQTLPATEKSLQRNTMSRPSLIALPLALVTLVVYLSVTQDAFLNFDDQVYVTENSAVQKGLTWDGIKWAFTTGHASNWHPLTWLSHMMDCQLFGLNPGAHHLVNVLFHAANAALLFTLLLRSTGALWPAAFIAALFAWHPLHVESVAWISERKDVLSTFFALLTLLSYAKFAKENCQRDFWFALIFFALGLMSKPMLVTLPFVLLLLDYWPLQRFPDFKLPLATVTRLTLEKWPFFLFAAISCIITFLVQRCGEAVMTLAQFPLELRFENALASYGRYLLKTIWPVDLAVLYPLPNHLHWIHATAAASAAGLVLISWLAWRARQICPYLLVGWLWFLGTLVPVIGLVQVGSAALADRYTYFPLIGIFLAATFTARDFASRFQFPKFIFPVAASLILAACLILTENQLRFWRDSESLFTHALAVTKDNANAEINLGSAFEQEGRQTEALAHYREAAYISPENTDAHSNIGIVLDRMGRPAEALAEYREAVRLNPHKPFLRYDLGIVLAELGRYDKAMIEFTNAAQLDPAYPWTYFQMAKILLQQGREAEAIDHLRTALRIDSENFQILAYTAHVLAATENPAIRNGKTALVLAVKANVLTGGSQPQVLDALGMACAETGDFTNAIEVTQKALDLANAAQMKQLQPLEQRLELYRNHQPWREAFLATNAPPEDFPKH